MKLKKVIVLKKLTDKQLVISGAAAALKVISYFMSF
jgi:hypothetical protein